MAGPRIEQLIGSETALDTQSRSFSDMTFYFTRFSAWQLRGDMDVFADFFPVCDLLRGLFPLLDSSARAFVSMFGISTLYRTAVRARLESFARDCLGL